MDMDRIIRIIDWFAGSGLSSFELVEGNDRIRLDRPDDGVPIRTPASVAEPVAGNDAAPDANETDTAVEAPIHGVLHMCPAPGEPPFVQPDQAVEAGETLCVVEAMKVLNPVTAPRDGVVTEIAVQDGMEVEQGQRLMVLR